MRNNKEVADERRKILENMNIKIPDFSKDPYKMNTIQDIDRNNSKPSSRRLLSRRNTYKNNLELNRSKDDRLQNQQFLTIDHTNKVRSDHSGYLPDVGAFKQNDIRAEDLEVEERALMNLYAQDFDDLKLLNLISGNKDIYDHKINQYKEMSKMRIDAEK